MKVGLVLGFAALAGCKSADAKTADATQPAVEPEAMVEAELADRAGGESILVCGEAIPIGTRVVLWTEEPYYDAYKPHPVFSDDGPAGLRFRPGRAVTDPSLQARVDARGFRREDLREIVDQFVLHYDVCGSSRRCFEVLHDLRGLSVHFLLDVDGTIYQTLDLADQAWHATKANPRSVGIEIASIGAYPPGEASVLEQWYERDAGGLKLRAPEGGDELAVGFEGRPARPDFVQGRIQGTELRQADFTPEQYEALIKLTAALCRELPLLEADAPRDADGMVRSEVLSDAEFERFRGILGHYHVQANKVDPGPAFAWEEYLEAVRGALFGS